jgi:hypothetical protein
MAGWAGANQVDARLIFWLKKIEIILEKDFQFSTIILKRHLFNNNTVLNGRIWSHLFDQFYHERYNFNVLSNFFRIEIFNLHVCNIN